MTKYHVNKHIGLIKGDSEGLRKTKKLAYVE